MKGLPKNTIAWLLFCGSLAAPSAWGFETNYDRGRVDFAGRVTDISCRRRAKRRPACRQR
ncbi:fimbrial-like protein [Klebsiella pneumoniae subsp. rhinoscleromatis]|nr:fimbrial-like protein [Klebsiella pneumoniae subsp. rhinoscleromatis]